MPMGKGLHPAYRDEPSASDYKRLAKKEQAAVSGPTASADRRYGGASSMEDAQSKILARDTGDDRRRAARVTTANALSGIANIKEDSEPSKPAPKTKIKREQF